MSTDLSLQHSEVKFLPLAIIDPPPDNPRRDFDEDDLAGLAASIEKVGLLEPVIVRPKGHRYELVAGERRFRACHRIGTETIAATIRELDDLQAAEIRLLENLDRRDLNPVEEADAFRKLCELGHNPETVAELVRRTKSEIDGRLGLLRLPERWQDRVRRGELPAPAAEYLVDFAGHPEILSAMEAAFKSAWPMPLTSWRKRLTDAVLCVSRSMDPEAADGPRFLDAEHGGIKAGQRKALDVVTVRHPDGRKEPRAMNCELWDRLQDAADEKARLAVRTEEAETSDAIEARSVARETREPAPRAIAPPEPPAPTQAEAVAAIAGDYMSAWLRGLVRSYVETLGPAELWKLAQSLELNPRERWRLDRSFLEGFSGDGLRDLAAELRVDISAARNESEITAILAHAARDQMPAAVCSAVGLESECVA